MLCMSSNDEPLGVVIPADLDWLDMRTVTALCLADPSLACIPKPEA